MDTLPSRSSDMGGGLRARGTFRPNEHDFQVQSVLDAFRRGGAE